MAAETVNERLHELTVRQAIFRERFKAGEARRLATLYGAVEDDLVAQLARRDPTAVSGRYTTLRLERLLDDVREILSAFGVDVARDITDALDDLTGIEIDALLGHIEEALPIRWDTVRPAIAQVKAAIRARPFQGRLLKEWFQDLTTATQGRVRSAIRIGVVEGETIDRIGRRVREATGVSRRAAEMVSRTAVNHVSTMARQETFGANHALIKGVQWVSVLDGRTSPICRARDHKVYPVDSGPRPPAHLNCRSSVTPVVKSWRDLGIDLDDAPPGTRASMNGQVPADMTYEEWLRKQPAAFQDDVLGKSKGALFRRGGISLDRFVDRAGQELTLAELRTRDAAAFDRAGL